MFLKELNKANEIKTVSLFSGAGGMDIGAIKAGAKIVWANDVMKEAVATYSTNIGDHIVLGDIDTKYEDLEALSDIDLVIGGPPCQGFSVAGKMDVNDKRSQLIWSFVKVVSIVKPKAFVLENVKALGHLSKWASIREKLLSEFRALGYSTSLIVVNATDYDVPQARERVFVIGFQGDSDVIPDIENMLKPFQTKAPFVREALSVLDKAGTGNNTGCCKAKITLASNPVMRKSPYAGMLFNGMGRPLRVDGYSSTLPASMGGNKTPIIDERELYNNEEPWIISYHSKLMEDSSIAIFQPAPDFLRRMTVEEAAALQTFPLGYNFCGSQSSKYTQIGNAVPCNLAYAVISMVVAVLKNQYSIIEQPNIKSTLF